MVKFALFEFRGGQFEDQPWSNLDGIPNGYGGPRRMADGDEDAPLSTSGFFRAYPSRKRGRCKRAG